VILPLSISGVVTGFALSFAHTMGEFGVVLMIGGNIPGVTRTISIDLYDQMQAGEYAAANQTALVLLAVSFLALALVYAANGGMRATRAARRPGPVEDAVVPFQ
jgi:molybdate transport system permease protein